MTSAAFTMDGTASYKAAAAAATVDLALASTDGVRSVQWRVVGSSSSLIVTPTIVATGAPNGVTATVDMPAAVDITDAGYAILIECKVNGGVGLDGYADPALIATGLLGVVNKYKRLPFAVGETFERDAATGTAEELNERNGVSGGLKEITPATLGANANNYGPTDFDVADVVRVSASGAVNITGLVAAGAKCPKYLLNVGANTITLKHADGGSSAENQFKLPGAADLSLIADKMMCLVYDVTGTRWRVVSVA